MSPLSRCLAFFMTALLILPPGDVLAFGHRNKKLKTGADKSPLSQDDRALHALNRLTFGPRPGDVATVEKIGLDKWIDEQLHPEAIDDAALEARLSQYPAMQLNLHQLTERFPTNAMIRQAESGKLAIPGGATERAIYNDQIWDLRERRSKQAEQAKQNVTSVLQPRASDQRSAISDQQASTLSQPSTANWPVGSAENSMAPPPTIAMAGPDSQKPAANGMKAGNSTETSMAGAGAHPAMTLASAEDKLYADLAATRVVTLPPAQRVNTLVAMQPADFRNFLEHLNKQDKVALFADLTPEQRETVFAMMNPQLVVGGEVLVTRLLRDIYSERQLEAVMTDFWLNHFNVYLKKGEYAPWYLEQYQDEVVRPHALGKFEDLLVATAESPAMLFYLDQSESVGPHSPAAMRAAMNAKGNARPQGLNENYAREVMELHTLGVDGGYTQRDVTQLAEVFTGWGIDHPDQGAEFRFNPNRHEPGQKIVLGQIIPQNGQNEGLEMLHILAVSPATAHHVSYQLAQRFVSDTPPPALVNAMAATWVKSGGDVREVLRTMLQSPLFWTKQAYHAKVKTPEEYVISAVRATGGQVVHPALLVEAMGQLGMPLYGCQTPNGYSWNADAWLSSGELLDRMNFSLSLADNNAGTAMDWDQVGVANSTPEQKESRLETLLLEGGVSDHTRQAALAEFNQQQGMVPTVNGARPQKPKPVNFVRPRDFGQLIQAAGPLPPPTDQDAALLAGLLLGSPEFQRR